MSVFSMYLYNKEIKGEVCIVVILSDIHIPVYYVGKQVIGQLVLQKYVNTVAQQNRFSQ